MVQKIQKRRTLWEYGKGSAFTTFPQYGDGEAMTGSVQEEKQTVECIPDISTLLRIGHLYFALTPHEISVVICFERCYFAPVGSTAASQGVL